MRVLHVITGLGVGGAEQQLRLLLRHLPAECEVATLTNPGPVADGLDADGVPVAHLGMDGNRDVTVLPRLTRLIHSGRYDVVHTHLYRACVYGRVAARLAGVRAVVATEHSLGDTQIEGRPLSAPVRALYRATERLGAGTLAVSETVASRLGAWGVPPERVHLAPNGVDPEAFAFSPAARREARARLGIPQDAYVVGGVGRQVAAKRFDVLVRAVAATRGARLLLVGDGPERVPLLRVVHQTGASDRVHFAGAHEDPDPYEPGMPGLLAAMDLLVSPSAEESFGLAVVEALAAGLPVLYAACPALEDLPPQDAPGARKVPPYGLAAAIRAEMLAGPRRLPVPPAVQRYHIARTAEAVMALYIAATAPAPATGRKAVTPTTPAQATPAPTTPAQATPPQATPALAPPAQATPTTPAQATPAQAAPAQAGSGPAAPSVPRAATPAADSGALSRTDQ